MGPAAVQWTDVENGGDAFLEDHGRVPLQPEGGRAFVVPA